MVGSLVVVAGGLADHTTEPANRLSIWQGVLLKTLLMYTLSSFPDPYKRQTKGEMIAEELG
jgi:hypothetical protein